MMRSLADPCKWHKRNRTRYGGSSRGDVRGHGLRVFPKCATGTICNCMRGPRVHLRLPEMADAREFLNAAKRSRGFHQGWVSPPSSLASYTTYFQRNKQGDFRGFL